MYSKISAGCRNAAVQGGIEQEEAYISPHFVSSRRMVAYVTFRTCLKN